MNTKKFDIHWTATQAEIQHWMQKESERMGDWLDTFVISWAYIGDEEIYRLELCSEASMRKQKGGCAIAGLARFCALRISETTRESACQPLRQRETPCIMHYGKISI